MGDLQGCMWRGAILLVAVTREQFPEVVVAVKRQATLELAPKSFVQDNGTNFGIIVIVLVLFGIEQIFLYLNSNKEIDSLSVPYNGKEEEKLALEAPTSKQQVECLSQEDNSFLTLLGEVTAGISKYPPQRAADGTSGVYFLKNAFDRNVGVFKPADEESIYLEDYSGGEIKAGCMPGEGYLKEVAAYLLDKGFHGVPLTALVRCSHDTFGDSPKVGSLQEFVTYESTAEDMGPSKFSTRDVHKIGLLDCRILNLDRHLGNILVTEEEGAYHLVPIDHALSLPSSITAGTFEWLQFPQCKKPFDEETVNFVCNIDVDSDVQMLRQQLPTLKEECLETMKISTLFLKKAVAKRFNLFEIGCMMSRYLDESEMSELERMYIRVTDRRAQSTADYWTIVDEEIERTLANKRAEA